MRFTETLLAWYDEHKRTLPWRDERDPYKIWVSEIILQQTRVQQGWDYYLRFIEAFPTPQALAEASEEQVLLLWQGLGYYSRARHIHAAAKQIMRDHNGIFPNSYEDIRKLKGIGDYTAAAIASIAFGLPYPAVDGNVLRIMSRIFGITDDIALPTTRKAITDLCLQHIDRQQPGIFNQACMDFGAIQCVPQNPSCDDCPFQTDCYAYRHQLVHVLPVKSKAKAKRDRFFHFFLYICNGKTILEKRTGRDIWRNLYQLPAEETPNDENLADGKVLELSEVLSHQVIHARFYLRQGKPLPALNENQIEVSLDEIRQYPMPKIMLQFLTHIEY